MREASFNCGGGLLSATDRLGDFTPERRPAHEEKPPTTTGKPTHLNQVRNQAITIMSILNYLGGFNSECAGLNEGDR